MVLRSEGPRVGPAWWVLGPIAESQVKEYTIQSQPEHWSRTSAGLCPVATELPVQVGDGDSHCGTHLESVL